MCLEELIFSRLFYPCLNAFLSPSLFFKEYLLNIYYISTIAVRLWNIASAMVKCAQDTKCKEGSDFFWVCFLFVLFSFLYFFLIFTNFLTLKYCIGFAIYWNESATGIHVFPILNPPPSSLPIPSLWVAFIDSMQSLSSYQRYSSQR